MSLVDTIVGRPTRNSRRSSTGTAVQAALAKPVPAGIDPAVAKVDEALAAYSTAHAALSELYDPFAKIAAEKAFRQAEEKLSDAVVQREVADRLGDHGPSDDDIAQLEKALSAARAAIDGGEVRKAAFRKAVDTRRDTVATARQEMWSIVDAWVKNIYEHADAQIAEGVRLIGEAVQTAAALETWQNRHISREVKHDSVIGGDMHRGPEEADLPPEIAKAVHAWRRANSAVNNRSY